MNKLLLVVGLVVLFFAQSSYADTMHRGIKSGYDWKHKTSGGKTYSANAFYKGKGHFTSKIQLTYYPRLSNFNSSKHSTMCFDFNSKTYFNIDRCGQVEFVLDSLYSNKKKTQKFGYQFIKNAMRDFCEDAIIEKKRLGSAIPLLGRGTTKIIVTCPKVVANKKRIQEEKKLAEQLAEQEAIKLEQEAIRLEQEAQAQVQVDAQQKKIETCEAYGFEKGSEPFGNCIFKLMELELEYAKLENEKLRLEAQAEQAKLNNQVALSQSLAAQAQASNRDKALRIQQFGLAMQGMAQALQPAQPTMPKITCNKFGNTTTCY